MSRTKEVAGQGCSSVAKPCRSCVEFSRELGRGGKRERAKDVANTKCRWTPANSERGGVSRRLSCGGGARGADGAIGPACLVRLEWFRVGPRIGRKPLPPAISWLGRCGMVSKQARLFASSSPNLRRSGSRFGTYQCRGFGRRRAAGNWVGYASPSGFLEVQAVTSALGFANHPRTSSAFFSSRDRTCPGAPR